MAFFLDSYYIWGEFLWYFQINSKPFHARLPYQKCSPTALNNGFFLISIVQAIFFLHHSCKVTLT